MEQLPDKIKCFKASAVVSWQMFRGFGAEPLNKRRWWPSVWNESRAPFRSHLEGGWGASRMWGKYMLKVPRFLWSRRRSKEAMRIYAFKMVGRFCKGHVVEINHGVPSVEVWRMETHYGNWRKPKKCVLGMYVNCWPKGSARNALLICTGADTGKVYPLWGERVTGARDVRRRQDGLISHLQKNASKPTARLSRDVCGHIGRLTRVPPTGWSGPGPTASSKGYRDRQDTQEGWRASMRAASIRLSAALALN